MLIVYILCGFSIFLSLTLIPLPRQKLKKTIKKFASGKSNRKFMDMIYKSFIIKLFVPKKGSRRYEKETDNIKKARINITLEQIVLIKIIVCLIGFLFILGVYANMNALREKGVLTRYNTANNAATNFLDDRATEQTDNNSVLNNFLTNVVNRVPNYKKLLKDGKVEELAKRIGTIRNGLNLDDDNDTMAKAVLRTLIDAYNVSKMTFTGIVLIFLLSILLTSIVDSIIDVKKKIIEIKVQKEFEKIEAVTILLMNRETINVVSLLQQMKQQSHLLKHDFQICLNQYSSNPTKAFDELVRSVDNVDFTKFITIIKQCLYSDKQINNEILKIQRNLRLSMQETKNKGKNATKGIKLTFAQFPLMLLFALIIIMPLLTIIGSSI